MIQKKLFEFNEPQPVKEAIKETPKIQHWNGDCLDLCNNISDKSIDLVFADLPYGTTKHSWDVLIPFEPLWKQINRVAKPNAAIIFTAQQPFATDIINSNRKMFRYELIWEKTMKLGFPNANRMPLRGHENILVFYKKLPTYNPQKQQATVKRADSSPIKDRYQGYGSLNKKKWTDDGTRYPHSVIKFSNWNNSGFAGTGKNPKHGTCKPIELMEWIVKSYSNENDTILDLTSGSGTTGITCFKTGRNCILIEKDADIFKDAEARLISMTQLKSKP